MTKKSHRRVPVWLLAGIFAYVTFLAALTALNSFGADRWWFAAFNLYLPQVLWVVPGVILTAISLKLARKWAWVPLLCVVWVLGPVMGFCWSPRPMPELPYQTPLRVMTWNVKYNTHGNSPHAALVSEIARQRPDVVLMQDAGGLVQGPLRDYLSAWHIRSFGQYVIASRFPLGEREVCSISFPGEEQSCPGTKHSCLRCRLYVNATTITLYNVHLESPRWGLNQFRTVHRKPWYLPEAIQRFEDNVEARLFQAHSLYELISRENGPVIVAGDLNSPDASRVCATLRDAGLHDAFAEAGEGYGYTYGHLLLRHRLPPVRLSWMRIDHIMLSRHLRTQSCWIGTGEASDHRPVIADIVLSTRKSPVN